MSNNKPKQKTETAGIDYKFEFYHRKWLGGTYHTHSNRCTGAFGITKKQWHKMVQEQNRLNKLAKLHKKTK